MAESPAGRLQREREEARALLADGYAQDLIDQGELDERLEAVERAGTVEELRALTAALRPVGSTALVPAAATGLAPAEGSQRIAVVFSSVERVGAWTAAGRIRMPVVFGSAVIDLRQASVPAGVVELAVTVVFGSLEILVPPGWRVENECGAVLADVSCRVGEATAADGRVLRIRGRVVFGSLAVEERLPGESGSEARRRRKQARKALAAGRRALPGK
jgi:hypothetical protein